jgi:hypothetical protein
LTTLYTLGVELQLLAFDPGMVSSLKHVKKRFQACSQADIRGTGTKAYQKALKAGVFAEEDTDSTD